MEMKFSQERCRCLRPIVSKNIHQEQTQELRLPDGMPDIGRILGVWGIPVVRGKEWRSDSMGVSGGIMANILYLPEDGSEPKALDNWIPFQLKWDLPQTDRDGFICSDVRLKSMDARSISPRKIMLRANIDAWGKALEPVDETIYKPQSLPEDVQIRTSVYPMELPMEFGEKQFRIEEELTPDRPIGQIIRCNLIPKVTEQRIIASRLVFRGIGKLDILHIQDGKLAHFETEIPFSLYADLDGDWSNAASAKIIPVLTNLETDLVDGKIHINAAMTAQYMIYDRIMVEVTEDSYSPVREVTPKYMQLKLPMRLDQTKDRIEICPVFQDNFSAAADISCMFGFPEANIIAEDRKLNLSGTVQVLYYDPSGELQGVNMRFAEDIPVAVGSGVMIEPDADLNDAPKVMADGDGLHVCNDFTVTMDIISDHGINMIHEMELGELMEPDSLRPSMILRRCGDHTLWDLAKKCGSSVSAITKANDLQGEPESERLLLIPII